MTAQIKIFGLYSFNTNSAPFKLAHFAFQTNFFLKSQCFSTNILKRKWKATTKNEDKVLIMKTHSLSQFYVCLILFPSFSR